ncbi:MAG: tRNA 2-thiocytidine(32) synthetase TtcA, partial [Burkholderiaceae bacterium]
SQENLQRKQIKAMLRDWEKKHPGRVDNIFSSLATVVPSHLMDRGLFEFATLTATGVADQNGDIAFDEAPCAEPQQSIVKIHA